MKRNKNDYFNTGNCEDTLKEMYLNIYRNFTHPILLYLNLSLAEIYFQGYFNM